MKMAQLCLMVANAAMCEICESEFWVFADLATKGA